MKHKRIAKRALSCLAAYSGAEWIRDKFWAARGQLPASILVFHRVSDDIPEDGITIGTARFRAIIQVLRDQYRPISLSELLNHLEQEKPWPKRTVVITFDDGYRDNYESAAPILEEYDAPAAFFVVADVIGTDCIMPWDEHLRGQVSWMDWRQLRDLQARGFEVGSHTLTHCNLGTVRGSLAWQEIYESKAKLEDGLGTEISLFAYPFGSRMHLLEENRSLVRQARYRCCCSGLGGFVTLDSDIYDLGRIPINNYFATLDDLHFELRTGAPWRWLRPVVNGRRRHRSNHRGSQSDNVIACLQELGRKV